MEKKEKETLIWLIFILAVISIGVIACYNVFFKTNQYQVTEALSFIQGDDVVQQVVVERNGEEKRIAFKSNIQPQKGSNIYIYEDNICLNKKEQCFAPEPYIIPYQNYLVEATGLGTIEAIEMYGPLDREIYKIVFKDREVRLKNKIHNKYQEDKSFILFSYKNGVNYICNNDRFCWFVN